MNDDDASGFREQFELAMQRAQDLAGTLPGLPVAQAQQRVDAEPGLSLRTLARDQPMTLELRSGRINAVVEDGVVVEAWAG